MSFTRRSRKGKIHVVRERVKKGHRYISGGLRDTNELTQYFASKVARDLGRGLKETGREIGYPSGIYLRTLRGGINRTKDSFNSGVNSIHRSSQRALAKGHQSIQSGLKKLQQNTGDFNMYPYRRTPYQCQPPVAMFSLAEVDKYNQYVDGEMAYFASFKDFSQDASKYAPRPAGPKKLTGAGKRVRGIMRAGSTAAGSVGYAGSRAARGVGLGAAKGLAGLGKGIQSAATGLGRESFLGKGVSSLGGGVRGLGKLVAKNPRLAAAAMLATGAGAVGAGGSMFMRRRRTKSGKIVVENVRR